jgi:hypothetical protein
MLRNFSNCSILCSLSTFNASNNFADGFSITSVSFVYAINTFNNEYSVYNAANLSIISDKCKKKAEIFQFPPYKTKDWRVFHFSFSLGSMNPMGRRLRGSLDCSFVSTVLMASS